MLFIIIIYILLLTDDDDDDNDDGWDLYVMYIIRRQTFVISFSFLIHEVGPLDLLHFFFTRSLEKQRSIIKGIILFLSGCVSILCRNFG